MPQIPKKQKFDPDKKEKIITIRAMCPSNVTHDEIAGYVVGAIESMGGGFRPPGGYGEDDPGDPFFYSLQVKSIYVKRPKRPRRR